MEYQKAKETNVYHKRDQQEERQKKSGLSGGASSSPSGRRVRYYDETEAQRRLLTTIMKQQEFIKRLRSISAQEILENQEALRSVPPATIISAGKDEGEQPDIFSSNHTAVSSMGDTYADREPAPCNPPLVESVKEKVHAQIKALPAFLANLAERTTAPTWLDCREIAMNTSNCSATKMFSDEGPCQGAIPTCEGAKEAFQGKVIADDPVLDAAGEGKGAPPGENNADDDSLLDTIGTAEITDDEGGNDGDEAVRLGRVVGFVVPPLPP